MIWLTQIFAVVIVLQWLLFIWVIFNVKSRIERLEVIISVKNIRIKNMEREILQLYGDVMAREAI